MITDEECNALSEKACIIRHDNKTTGWDPSLGDYVLVSNPTQPDITKLSEFIKQCVHSFAVNIPKSISNLLAEGESRGYSEESNRSLWLQFIKHYAKDSYQPALAYSC